MKINIDRLDLDELEELGVEFWPVWEHEEDKFEWFYDKTEHCYIVAGEATVVSEFKSVIIKAENFVTFPAGLDCVWDIDIAIKKHYKLE